MEIQLGALEKTTYIYAFVRLIYFAMIPGTLHTYIFRKACAENNGLI